MPVLAVRFSQPLSIFAMSAKRWRRLVLAGLGWLLLVQGIPVAANDQQVWIRVDTDRSLTEVWRGGERMHVMERVAFGRGGISELHLQGDHTTPLGKFRISRVNRESRFHIFLGINYPTLEHLDEARQRGIMSDAEYRESLSHGIQHGEFPQDGTLGGYIGFHGIGAGDPNIHDDFHWTQGCIAMTNEQIETLHSLIEVGTPVIIE